MFYRVNKQILLVGLLASTLFSSVFSQEAVFLYQGAISFEKRVNANYFLKEEYGEGSIFYHSYLNVFPEFNSTNYTLYFNRTATFYKRDNPVNSSVLNFTERAGASNEVFKNLLTDSSVTLKIVNDQPYLINDEIRKLRWKITDETRIVAGFRCHRANAILFDSIYIVAYYSDQIPVSGGPESFGGLPGMILGLAIPRLHTTWFALSIKNENPSSNIQRPHVPQKPITGSQFLVELSAILDKKNKNYFRSSIQALL